MISIQLSEQQFKDLMEYSELFRHIVMEKFRDISKTPDPLNFWRTYIRKYFPDYKREKIPAIKWLRDVTKNNDHARMCFQDCGFDLSNDRMILSLFGAKKFVESC